MLRGSSHSVSVLSRTIVIFCFRQLVSCYRLLTYYIRCLELAPFVIIKQLAMASFVVNICYAISYWTVDINGVKRCEWGNAYLRFVGPSLREIPALIVNNI